VFAQVRERCDKRAKATGRMIPEAMIRESLEAPDRSLGTLTPLVDFVARINNDGCSNCDYPYLNLDRHYSFGDYPYLTVTIRTLTATILTLLRLSVPLLRLSVPLLRLSVPFLRLSAPLLRFSARFL
jgi:hypothetical protein